MSLPIDLQSAIEDEFNAVSLKELAVARKNLSESYRTPHKEQHHISTDAHRLAYLGARLPATFAAVKKTLEAMQVRSVKTPASMLDLGAGPGTAMWAASTVFPAITQYTLFEQDASWVKWGHKLAQHSTEASVRESQWKQMDLTQVSSLPEHDWIILSYSIGELTKEAQLTLLTACWRAARDCLIIIEPGTPVGFERIRLLRQTLIDWGAHLVAPCPHAKACPMADGNWCHFSARVERSAFHRQLKEGSLGYEDEKFSYVAVSKTPMLLPEARILRHPMKHSGHVELNLCAREGLKQMTISKKMGEAYKKARKAEWGDDLYSILTNEKLN